MTKLNGRMVGGAALLLMLTAAMLARAQTFKTRVSFDGDDGAAPYSPPVPGRDGNLYGATYYGGPSNCDDAYGEGCGVVYRVNRGGAVTALYTFSWENLANGIFPGALVLATDGEFYGTTSWGGINNGTSCYDNCGTIFKITAEGVLTTIYSFCAQPDCADGIEPRTILQATDGNFYGTTSEAGGGTGCDDDGAGCGTIFRMSPNGNVTTLYRFCANPGCSDGGFPTGLVEGADGNFYGTTLYGGNDLCYGGCGTAFKITPQGKLTTLYEFCAQPNCTDGSEPSALNQALDGDLYGTASGGGMSGNGTFFRITFGGRLKVLHSFCNDEQSCQDGRQPIGGVIQATDGNFYGTTAEGGSSGINGNGTIFKSTATGLLTTLFSFNNSQDGANPTSSPAQSTIGLLYGTTPENGNFSNGPVKCTLYGCGTIYSLNVGLGPFIAFVQAAARAGKTAQILGQGFEGATSVSFNGVLADFDVRADTFLTSTVPEGATTGFVTVTTPTGVLTSNVPFHVIP